MPASGYNTQTQSISGFAQQVALPDGVVGVFSTLSATGNASITGNLTVAGTFTPGVTVNAPVAVTAATLTVTAVLYAGKTIVQNAASGCAISLPAATGTGARYRIYIQTTITSVGVVISCAPLTDKFTGMAWVMSDNSQAVLAYLPASTDNTFTLNGTTQGGYAGHLVEFQDVASGIWSVQSWGKATGAEATPFSHV